MKLTVYKSKKTIEEVEVFLRDNGYEPIGEQKFWRENALRMELYMETHEKNAPGWVGEVMNFFDAPDFENEGAPEQYNAIIVVRTNKSIYLLPQGQGFRKVEKLADMSFGLDFAEKAILDKDISLKGVSYVQRNKMRGVINYKREQTEFPQASESYFSVSGKPRSETTFGSNITCGTGITFVKNYNLCDNDEEGRDFIDLFGEIDITMALTNKISSIPRLKKVRKNNELNSKLDNHVLDLLKSEKSEEDLSVAFNINKIQLINNKITMLENDKKMHIYILNRKNDTEEEVALDSGAIHDYIVRYKQEIEDISQLQFSVYDGDDKLGEKMTFKQICYCEMQFEGKIYLLDNGRWGYFNNRFYDLIEEKIKEINEIIFYDSTYSCRYISDSSGEYSGEGGYIEELTKLPHMIKLHKRNINTHGTKIEIADVFNRKNKELLAIKRGTETSMALYSFEQSLLSMQVLSNAQEFKVRDELSKYNDRAKFSDSKKYPNLTDKMLDEILVCKTSCVLWLVNEKVKYVYEGVRDEKFDLLQFGSLLLKLKIIDWYSFTKDNGYSPKIYFALDLPTVG
ncbi:TIGR04141 family sporadically distributed protein [Listeria sp. FSL L7-1582]|uniref:DUF6119 family protein n=1 Tax=Listeria portnoyi TaxID=2713504 RepID=UPI00164E7285|nr:DUF6119 family protein [Listeria portnoyi]MBC6308493.1 TIGR04141 family sporadically distributed protein [Listeria portnoyi]